MGEIYSLPASTSLRQEFQALAPNKATAQNGTIGDRAHMERASDHNLDEIGNTGSASDPDSIPEVHARDEDSRGPWPADWSMERCVQIILGRCRSGAEKRLRYVIYDGRIWQAKNGWRQEAYSGADQHREHAHFSFVYGSGSGPSNPENITSPWGFLAVYAQENGMDEKSLIAAVRNTPEFLSDTERIYIGKAVAAQLAGQFTALVTAIGKLNAITPAALAKELAPTLAAAVVAALPDDKDDVTAAEIETALRNILAEGLVAPK
jgi:hypothetical protein